MKTGIIVVVFIVLAVLHQDFWNWDNSDAVFGFIPVGLAYHAVYTLVAALFWGCVIWVAWPSKMERWADGEDE